MNWHTENNTDMKVSVIIPTYKPQAYIWECLDSIKNQTFSKEDFEVILVLNGCNEPYYSQIKEYIDNNHVDYNVNFIQTDQGGVSNARNIGLDNATGEYIAFIDDDDYISPKYLECLYEKVAPDTISLCYPYKFNDGCTEQLPYVITDAYESNINNVKATINTSRKFFQGPCMKLIHKGIIDKRYFSVKFKNGEDSIFMFLISDKIKRITLTDKTAIYYRRIRYSSATTSERHRKEIIYNSVKMIYEYFRIYIRSPFEYNFLFFTTRILGSIKSIIG